MSPIFENDPTTLTRRLVDRLPHELRRQFYRFLRPKHFQYLHRMRSCGSTGRANRLTEFIRTRSIFLHIPKCAGRSVRFGLYNGMTASHMSMHNYSIAFSAGEFRSYFKFTIVRDPWDRLHSAYRFLMSGGLHDLDRLAAATYLAPHPDFEAFVMRGLSQDAVTNVVHLRPMSHFAEVCPGWMPLDRICRYERLEDDLREVAGILGIDLPDVPWENRTPVRGPDFRQAYSDEMAAKVGATYQRDLDLFGYQWRG